MVINSALYLAAAGLSDTVHRAGGDTGRVVRWEEGRERKELVIFIAGDDILNY